MFRTDLLRDGKLQGQHSGEYVDMLPIANENNCQPLSHCADISRRVSTSLTASTDEYIHVTVDKMSDGSV